MPLDNQGVLMTCSSCGTTNRLRYDGLKRAIRCGKCQKPLHPPAAPIEVQGEALFDAAVARSSVPVVVDFWAAWCAPCRMMAPELDKAARELAGRALVLKVDTDANPELSERFGIRSIPTLGVFRNGREVNRVSGVQSATGIAALATRRSAVNS